MSRFYVYAILVDKQVRYIGKGTSDRSKFHEKRVRKILQERESGPVKASFFYNRLAKAVRLGLSVQDEILIDGLEETDAFAAEIELIASYPEGQLWNTREGGNGFSSNDIRRMWADPVMRERLVTAIRAAKQFPEYREKMSFAHKERYAANPELRLRDSEIAKRIWQSEEYRNKVLPKLQAVWQDDRIAARLREYHASEEASLKKREIANKLYSDPERKREWQEKTFTSDTRARLSESAKKKWETYKFNDAARQKMSEAARIQGERRRMAKYYNAGCDKNPQGSFRFI